MGDSGLSYWTGHLIAVKYAAWIKDFGEPQRARWGSELPELRDKEELRKNSHTVNSPIFLTVCSIFKKQLSIKYFEWYNWSCDRDLQNILKVSLKPSDGATEIYFRFSLRGTPHWNDILQLKHS
jgi:hypothetical protein